MSLQKVTLALLLGAFLPVTNSGGVINVSVVDLIGNPVQGSLVRADFTGRGITASLVLECLTDKAGKCSIEDLSPGEYAVNACKEGAGYPKMFIPLYRHGEPLKTVEITSSRPTTDVTLTLDRKAASIEISVTDALTGRRVKDPTIILRRAVNPSDFLSTRPDVHSRVLIPDEDPILVEVIADGYKPWHYEASAPALPANALKLHSAELRSFTVKLQPDQPTGNAGPKPQ